MRRLLAVVVLLSCGSEAHLKPIDLEPAPPESQPIDAGPGLVEAAPQVDAGLPATPDAGTPDAGTPPAPSLPPTTRQTVAAGAMFSCALAQGDVYCWGKNDHGQLGNLSSGSSPVPVRVPQVAGAIEVSAGQDHACALGTNGRVWCWGANDLGQLGRGTRTPTETPDFVPGLISIRSVSAGQQGHSCALTANGLVTCWGRGLGNAGAASATPVPVAGISNAQEVSAGDHHVCALLTGGALWCWGGNFWGALGDGTTTERQSPAPVLGLPPVAKVSAGNGMVCAVSASNEVWCWGRGESGQAGTNTLATVTAPQQLLNYRADRVFTSGGLHTCGRATDGSVSCWGSNAVGQLGNGMSGLANEVSPVPTAITDATGGAAGAFHTCVRRAAGGVACWGINSDGQLGDGHSGTLSMAAVEVIGLP